MSRTPAHLHLFTQTEATSAGTGADDGETGAMVCVSMDQTSILSHSSFHHNLSMAIPGQVRARMHAPGNPHRRSAPKRWSDVRV